MDKQGGVPVYYYEDDRLLHVSVTLASGTVSALRDVASRCDLFTPSGRMAHKPNLSELLTALVDGRLVVLRSEDVSREMMEKAVNVRFQDTESAEE